MTTMTMMAMMSVYCSYSPLSCCGQWQQVQNVNVIHVHAFRNSSL